MGGENTNTRPYSANFWVLKRLENNLNFQDAIAYSPFDVLKVVKNPLGNDITPSTDSALPRICILNSPYQRFLSVEIAVKLF